MSKQNWFNTLNDSLVSEDLLHTFPVDVNPSVGYDQTLRYVQDGIFVCVYRDSRGMYERPIYYASKCEDFVEIIIGE